MPVFETIQTKGVPVKLFADQVDQKARNQLIDLAESGLAEEFVAAMPDVHYGMGATIGSVFASTWAVCPNAVGVDIGCGMAAVPFPGLHVNQLTAEKKWDLHRRIKESIPTGMQVHSLDQWAPVLDDKERTPWLSKQLHGRALRTLGTLGGGNHFIEIVHDPSGQVWVMLHSGSRNLGKITADRYNDMAKQFMAGKNLTPQNADLNYLLIDSQEGQDYLTDMNWCQKFALANRQAMLEILGQVMESETKVAPGWDSRVNIHHNFCSRESCGYFNAQGEWVEKEFWITRKGATSARALQQGLIPGSMAVGSWLVEGLGNWESWYSCSHGAGRTKSRTASFAEIPQAAFEKAMSGIVAETVPELRDEAPQAYKDLAGVMACQKDLVKPVLRLLPLVNIKGWDPKGSQPWSGSKVAVTFDVAPELGLTVDRVEAHLSEKGARPVAHWVKVEDFVLRASSKGVGSPRELWIKVVGDEDHKHLAVGRVVESDETHITIRIDSVKKKERM